MKKVIAVFAVAVFAATAIIHAKEADKGDPARAAYNEVYAYVNADLKSNGWSNAAQHLAACDQVLADYPDASREVVRDVQYMRFFCIYRTANYAAAITAGEKFLRDYPDASPVYCANICLHISNALKAEGKLADAQAFCERALADYPNVYPLLRATVQSTLAGILDARGEKAAAQAAYMTLVTNYAWHCSMPDEQSVIWRAFEKVNPMLLSTEDYRAFLDATIKGTRATEENAKFLGRVKSELEKTK